MRHGLISGCRLRCGGIVFLALGAVLPRAQSADLKLEALLVWGTNDERSPDPGHKPIGAQLQKKLKSLPFKWANYFEVNRQQFVVPGAGSKKVAMSKECEILVKNVGNGEVELMLVGKGEKVGRIKQALPKGELLVTGGNAPNFTAWFVVLRQID